MSKSKLYRRYQTASTVSVRAAGEGDGADSGRVIEGYAVVFGSPSVVMGEENGKPVREYIDPSAITRALLDESDIRLTMEHDFCQLLGRSNRGQGTLSYEVDDHGVRFSCEMPRTMHGDNALELVRRGDIGGCSFMFCIEQSAGAVARAENEEEVRYTIRRIDRIIDFTLTNMPAYPDTDAEARSLMEAATDTATATDTETADSERRERQYDEMQQQSNLINNIQ